GMSEAAVVYTAEEALERLVTGNERFVAGRSRMKRASPDAELAAGQRPFATILGCSDSRVPPELLFDAGFGELFIVRVAGNLVLPAVMGSLQYAGVHLRTPLFMVLGHEGCGAVAAALEARNGGAGELSRVKILVESILPGLADLAVDTPPEQQLSRAVEANVRWSMHQLLDTPEGRARLEEGHARLVGGVYELTTGRVRLLD